MNMQDLIKKLETIDLFKDAKDEKCSVGRPFSLDYDKAKLLVADDWKLNVKGMKLIKSNQSRINFLMMN